MPFDIYFTVYLQRKFWLLLVLSWTLGYLKRPFPIQYVIKANSCVGMQSWGNATAWLVFWKNLLFFCPFGITRVYHSAGNTLVSCETPR